MSLIAAKPARPRLTERHARQRLPVIQGLHQGFSDSNPRADIAHRTGVGMVDYITIQQVAVAGRDAGRAGLEATEFAHIIFAVVPLIACPPMIGDTATTGAPLPP